MKVYLLLDRKSNSIKIGKANDVEQRLSDLQVGNPNELEVLTVIPCNSEKHSIDVERQLHNDFKEYHMRGEWFRYDEEVFSEIIEKGIDFTHKKRRESLILTRNTLYGEEVIFDSNDAPNCFFYPWLKAQVLDKFENLANRKKRYRTMKWPTKGKQMLLPYSHGFDEVFISDRKHKENIMQKNHGKKKDVVEVSLISIIEEKSNLDAFL
jgi:hypothetical protein